jgi:SAM-dependent methyltransferase
MTPDPIRQRYDQVPYESDAFPFLQPSRIAALAQLAGLRPPPAAMARVLELGCASGGNLISFAQQCPQAHCVGIDLSEVQIAAGQRVVRDLGLTNVELKPISILDITPEFGQFDYLLAHGVYSWVPADVRDKLLQIFAQNMSENGLACVSYYVWPGNYPATVIRELLTLHARTGDASANEVGGLGGVGDVGDTRKLITMLVTALQQHPTPIAPLLKSEAEVTAGMADWYLTHDVLAPVNEPVWVHQFLDRVAQLGLHYIGDALPNLTALEQFPPTVRQMLRTNTRTPAELEQWIDVLAQRSLRKSILSRQPVPRDRDAQARAHAARGLFVSSPAKVETPQANAAQTLPADVLQFAVPEGSAIGTADPVVKRLVLRLIDAWPESLSVDDLLKELSGTWPPQKLLTTLVQMVAFGLVQFDAAPPSCRKVVSDKPQSSALARYLASRGENEKVTNLRHETAALAPLHRLVLAQLDGSRTREQILKNLAREPQLERSLDTILVDLANLGFLQS